MLILIHISALISLRRFLEKWRALPETWREWAHLRAKKHSKFWSSPVLNDSLNASAIELTAAHWVHHYRWNKKLINI